MKRQTKLNSTGEQIQQVGSEQQTRQGSALEFATAEEMLRYDAERTAVPPGIAQKLRESTKGLPPPRRPWWRRLFNT